MPNLRRFIPPFALFAALCVFALIPPARAATHVTTNDFGQIQVQTDVTNLTQLLNDLGISIGATYSPAKSAVQTAIGYFSSFNPELEGAFATNRGYAYAGVDSISGGNISLANSILIDYGIWKNVAVESLTRDGGVSGAIISQSAGLAINLPFHDVNVAGFIHGGYDFTVSDSDTGASKYYLEAGARVMKALSRNFYSGIGLSAKYPSKEKIVTAFGGFMF